LTAFNSRLLTPPREEEEIYPYRRVWRSLILENGIMFGVALVFFVLVNFLGFAFPDALRTPLKILIALLPAILWFAFSWMAERLVPEPRTRLLSVALVSGLIANAVGLPFLSETLQVERWLSLASAIDRIVGYTITSGIVYGLLQYLVLRYLVWSDVLRTRLDAIAYGAACAVGYATILNLDFVLSGSPPPDVVAMRVFSMITMHTASSIILAYGLAESRFSNANPFLLPLMMAFSALIIGIAIPIRAGLTNASITLANLQLAAPRPLFGLLFSGALIVAISFAMAFLFNNAERQEREQALEG
jgi:hypothetical protein